MGIAQPADVVVHLHAGVVVDHRDEEGHAEAVTRAEIEGGIRQRPAGAGIFRALVGPRPIFTGVLETQLVQGGVGNVRNHRAGKGPGATLFVGVGAAAPGIDVEGAVFLLRVGVVETAGDEVAVRGLPVDFAEVGDGVASAFDRAVFIRRAERGEGVHHPLLDAARVLLFGFVAVLGIERGEKEDLVGLERTAQRETGLEFGEVRLRLRGAVGALRRGRQRVVFVDEVGGALEVVGARFGDDGHKTGGGAAEFGRRAVGDDDEFLHGVEVEGEGRALTAALLTEEGVVEVGTVDRNVVLDTLLTVDRKFVAVRTLNDRHTRGELGQLEEVAAVVGDAVDGFAIDFDRVLRARNFDQRRLGGDHDFFFGGHQLHLNIDGQGGAEVQLEAFAHQGVEAVEADRHLVRAKRQQRRAVPAAIVGGELFGVVGAGIGEADRHSGQHGARRIGDGAFDDTGRGLALGKSQGGKKQGKQGQEDRQAAATATENGQHRDSFRQIFTKSGASECLRQKQLNLGAEPWS